MKNCKILMLLGFLMMAFSVFSQGTVTGTLIDQESNMPMPGANVVVKGTSNGVVTDFDGKFSISVPNTTGQLIISFVGYLNKTISFNVPSGQTVNVGTVNLEVDSDQLDEVIVVGRGVIDLAKGRNTPIAVSSIKSAEIQQKIGTFDITQTMVNTPSVYVAGQAGGFGDSRIAVRGFGQDNTAFLLNGQPINGMEDGLMYWSNWSGMADIANLIQVQRGLGSSKLAISSVGGTVNFITKATDKKEGGFVSTAIANDDYLKTTAAYNTGMSKKGFGMSVMLTHWQGDGYNDGTKGEGQNYFISFGYKPSEKHNFNLLLTGAPQWHDQNFTKTIASYLQYGRKYNNNWGYLNGQYKSERTNFYHKPVANLNWDWTMSEKSSLSTVLYASWGRGGGTGNYGASIPSSFRTNGQINFDALVDRNLENGGVGVALDGKSYLIRSSMNNHNWYGLVTNFNHKFTDNLEFNAGADVRTYYGTHYRQVADFLGLTSWTESRTLRDNTHQPIGSPVSNTVTESLSPRPWESTFNSLSESQHIDYNNSERISYGGVFGQLEYANDNFSTFFQGAVSSQTHQRFDRYDYLAEYEDSEKVDNIGYNVKAGGSYKINQNHVVFINGGYYSRQPYHDNIYLNFTNQINPLTENEKILGLEAGYGFNSTYFSANLNAYRTSWKDRVKTSSRVNSEGNELFTTNEGVEQLHSGLELDFVVKPFSKLEIRGFASIGNWEYQDKVVTTVRDQDRNVESVTEVDVDGGKVGDAAQTTAGVGLKYTIFERFSVDSDLRFYDEIYSNVGAVKENLQLPSYEVVDFGASYKWLVGKDKANSIDFRLNINNLLHKIYLSELRTNIKTTDLINSQAPEQGTYLSNNRVYNGIADGNQGFFGLGRTWSFTIRYNF
ncbi:TonB-dependent receptor [Flavobacterium azooxidireducens]|uniref:TonB-dependent receptor n=1 Tax=Flavobacterium azooxidireducens TaxID=1871076 RepID=A0ABY4KIH7_9FLAO|nr:carboxypeptidase-like regulatory domain-containing protein [Flavobacterium azooxidireducens]UPQ80622.1 TonB-dependent receptor [Flavobacterium azooxidireducens]